MCNLISEKWEGEEEEEEEGISAINV